ncbi:GlyGly-CTERM sorting domain-containing protein [Catenovulum sp. SM1970]|uniref:GlyGly-CTERM sorting domain-containing protein n=1 Tax=Marinifaba aquimaris TaxID=2741323 RepID=UPI001572A795|nr:GlyGly-CTERM sorting domain-containing protein [Marinifaba aquimaris]NTS76116.1 GlyGly-CTERM sorting domain-containing protein [Marinifaba aquimaris]
MDELISTLYGLRNVSWSSNVSYKHETITTPVGEFDTLASEFHLWADADIDGNTVSLYYMAKLHFAEDIGLVRIVENFDQASNLTYYSGLPIDDTDDNDSTDNNDTVDDTTDTDNSTDDNAVDNGTNDSSDTTDTSDTATATNNRTGTASNTSSSGGGGGGSLSFGILSLFSLAWFRKRQS